MSAALLSTYNPSMPRAVLSAVVCDGKKFHCGSLVFVMNVMFVMHALNVT